MPFKHVVAPRFGQISNAPPSMINPEASPYVKGMYVKDGEVVSDFGYVGFPAGKIDDYAKLLLHCDGTDASTTFIDEVGKVITANGNAQIDTAQSKFGGASGLFDGTGDYLSTPDHADWAFGSGDFTIDFWVRLPNPIGYTYAIVSQRADTNNRWVVWIDNNSDIRFEFMSGGAYKGSYYTSGITLGADTWYHIAVERVGTTAKVFLDGVEQTLNTDVAFGSNDVGDIVASLEVGRQNNSLAYLYLNGWIDELRISKGIARWTANFTPPTATYVLTTLATKTNFLNGAVMKIDTFYTANGMGRLLTFTTTNVYQYNTSTYTWDNITKGTDIEDCEDDWTASAEVTAVAQTTYKLRGSKAVKVAIGADFTTGVAAYEDFSALNLSASVPYTDLACAQNTTTVTSATGGFTSNMAGRNLVIASGTNFIAGTYRIMRINSVTSIEVDASPATAGAGSAGVGTAARSALTHLHFWVYSSVALTSGDYKMRVSEESAGGTLGGATVYTDFTIPNVAVNTWTPCCVAGSFATLNAVLSISLVVINDKGAVDIYLDDIRAVTAFTGDEDNRFSTTTMNDTFVVTNGIDQTQKYTGVALIAVGADLVTTLAAGSITTSEVVFTFKDHLFLMNNTENAANCPQRVSWTNIGAIEDWTGGTAGYQDLVDDVSWVVGAALLSENEAITYKERSIVSATWVGGHTPFRFKTQVLGTGALSKDAIDSGTGEHLIVGPDVTYAYKGGTEIDILDDKIKKVMYGRLNREYANRLFLIYIEEDDELQIWIPTDTAYPDEVWCTNVVDETWYRKARIMTAAGYYQEQSSLTIGDLIGTIGEQNWRFGDALVKKYAPTTLIGDSSGYVYKIDKTTLNNDGSAITNEFQTPDFVLPDSPDYMNMDMFVSQLLYEAAGQSISTYYSVDSGETWSPTQGAGGNTVSLTSGYKRHQQDFAVTCDKIRFKFLNTTASSGYRLRYYGFYWRARARRG